LLIESEVRIL